MARSLPKYFGVFGLLMLCLFQAMAQQPRVIVSSDIGGTDEDDFQSMIHYLMYADRFRTEGLIASPYGEGRTKDIHHIIDLYEKDYSKLKARSADFPSPDALRKVVKQGATERAPSKGWHKTTEGSDWIIQCAKRESDQPLWVLVWGGIEDVTQALHDAPEIAQKLRVYWIGGPNKKWGADTYAYLVRNFPDLWIIEANATYRGWFVDDGTDQPTNVKNFYNAYIKNKGAMGPDFIKYYEGVIKMGDTPSVAYLLHGDPDDPRSDSWGGSFVSLGQSAVRTFTRMTTHADTVPTFSLTEWEIAGPESGFAPDEPCVWMEVSGQQFEGYYEGDGRYKIRFVPKSTGSWDYQLKSEIPELDGLKGGFVSADPWPGEKHPQNIPVGPNWWSDDPHPENFEGNHQGAKSIFKWQKEFMMDWATRWDWLSRDGKE